MSLIFVRILLVTFVFKYGFGKSRVNDGKEISMQDDPHMARVDIALTPFSGLGCDGSILNAWFILTAGHCCTDESNINVPNPPLNGANNYTIIVGVADLNVPQEGQILTVSKVFFREYSSKNDICILRLKSKINLDGITKKAVTLPKSAYYSPKSGTQAYVDGWGSNPEGSKHLLRANIYTTTAADCNASPYQICTLGVDGAKPCQGDSGGPMLQADDGVQIGVVSFVTLGCENTGTRSIFTSVARNLPWIRRIMNGQMTNMDDIQPGSITIPTQPPATTRRPLNFFQGFFSPV